MSSIVYIYNDYVLNGHVQVLRKKAKWMEFNSGKENVFLKS